MQQTAAIRDELERKAEVRREALEQEFAQKQAALEEAHKVRQEELARREAAVDASDSRSARRRLRNELGSILKDRSVSFELTAATQQKRVPVMNACGVIGTISLASLLYSVLHPHPGVAEFVARGLSAVAFAAVVWFYIRWQDRWFSRHAEEEFRLKRLELDMNRASWVVELAMEYSAETKSDIPTSLLEQLSRNLFVDVPEKEPVDTPLGDAITTLLGSSAQARLPLPTGGEVVLDKRSAKALNKEAEA